MIKIITALDNPILNNKVNKENDIQTLCKDIQYQDGVLEILEKYKEVDFLIISELLTGKYKIEELIYKIKEKNKFLKIIIILENKKEELENFLYAKGVYKIFYNNEIEIKNIINILKNNKEKNIENNSAKDELEKLKKILSENNIEINLENKNPIKINNKKYLLKIIDEKIKENNLLQKINYSKNNKNLINEKCKIISILGIGGVGKSIITIGLAKTLKKENKKVLIIDFDILNNSLHTILGVNKYPEKIKEKIKKNNLIKSKIQMENLKIKINKNLDLISGIILLFDSKYKISSEKVKFILKELQENYNYIIIDNTSECFFDYTKNIILNCDYSILILEPNILEIQKAKKLLNIYTEKWKIEKDKIKIIMNKYNKNSIDENIIKDIFSKYKILGKIDYSEIYNILIEKRFDENIFNKIMNSYKKIINSK